jgi:hypothetical protein
MDKVLFHTLFALWDEKCDQVSFLLQLLAWFLSFSEELSLLVDKERYSFS